MKAKCGVLVMMMFFLSACASTPYNPGKPEMSVPESDTRTQPRTFNQFHNDWEY